MRLSAFQVDIDTVGTCLDCFCLAPVYFRQIVAVFIFFHYGIAHCTERVNAYTAVFTDYMRFRFRTNQRMVTKQNDGPAFIH